jgi:hypothetical protein
LSEARATAPTRALSHTLLLGEQPPGPDDSVAGITNYWNALNHDNFLGVANTTLWRPTQTSRARFPNDQGPPCPPVAYFGPGDLTDMCSINHLQVVTGPGLLRLKCVNLGVHSV